MIVQPGVWGDVRSFFWRFLCLTQKPQNTKHKQKKPLKKVPTSVLTLESWFTAITNHADNNAKQLPKQYSISFRTSHFYSHTSISIVFIIILFFSHFFSIYFNVRAFYLLLVKDYRLIVKSSFFHKFWIRDRFSIFEMSYPGYSSLFYLEDCLCKV